MVLINVESNFQQLNHPSAQSVGQSVAMMSGENSESECRGGEWWDPPAFRGQRGGIQLLAPCNSVGSPAMLPEQILGALLSST